MINQSVLWSRGMILTKKGVVFFRIGSLASPELVITVVAFITLITGNGGSVFAPFTSLLLVSYTSQLRIKKTNILRITFSLHKILSWDLPSYLFANVYYTLYIAHRLQKRLWRLPFSLNSKQRKQR